MRDLRGWRTLTPHQIAGEDKSRIIIGPFGSSLKTVDYRSFGVPLIFVKDIRAGNFQNTRAFVSPDKARELRSHIALPGDVLITKMGDPPGDSTVYSGTRPAVITADCIRLRPVDSFDSRFIAYAIQAPSTRQQMEHITSGVAQRKVSLARFRTGLAIPVPSLSEQRRIVDILEDHLSRFDAADTSLRAALARGEALLTGGLWRATHHHPDSRPTQLKDVAEVRLGRQRSPKNHNGDRMRPYLRAANVGWDELRLDDVKEMQFTAAEEATYRLEDGDILLTEASGSPAEVGKSVVYRGSPSDVCFQNTLLRVRCHAADPEFVQKYLLAEARAGRFMPESRGVGINHLGRARLASLMIALPSISAQIDVVTRTSDLVANVDRLRTAVAAQRVRTLQTRRAVLAAAFSGKLTGRPTDQEVIEEEANV